METHYYTSFTYLMNGTICQLLILNEALAETPVYDFIVGGHHQMVFTKDGEVEIEAPIHITMPDCWKDQ